MTFVDNSIFRILDGEPGVRLLAWLNALPEVQAILARDFAGRPINDQNFSEWKHGGYIDWLNIPRPQPRRHLAEYSAEITETLGASPAEFLPAIVATRLAASGRPPRRRRR